MIFKVKHFYHSASKEHVGVLFFAGPDRDHLAMCGRANFRREEADRLLDAVNKGMAAIGQELIMEQLSDLSSAARR